MWEIYTSARNHGVADEDILHALTNAMVVADADEDPDKVLYLGPDRAGNLLEVITAPAARMKSLFTPWPCARSTRCFLEVVTMAERPKSYGRSRSGVELTEETLEKLAAEADAGLDVSKLRRRRGRPPMGAAAADSFPVRLDPELRSALDARAEEDETTPSEVIREALRRYLKVS